ncbi:hypothetical protein ACVWY2_000128 [Bradyrhizobium sp. JR6.1]
MRQTILSVVLEVNPESAEKLSLIVEKLKQEEENPGQGMAQSYDGLKTGVPLLHFMSMSVFLSADYDPIFFIEVNFDGERGPFWAQFEARLGPYLRPDDTLLQTPGRPRRRALRRRYGRPIAISDRPLPRKADADAERFSSRQSGAGERPDIAGRRTLPGYPG